MKNLYIGFLIWAILTVGCKKDALDITPDGRITLEKVFSDVKLTEAFLNRTYSTIPSYAWRYNFWNFLGGNSDEGQDANQFSGWHTGALSPSYNPLYQLEQGVGANHWPTFWKGIRDANVFIENIDNAPVEGVTYRSRFKSEARVLRAFFYLELIKQFGPMPIVDKSFPNGYDYSQLTRASFQENINFIVKDCDDAIGNPDMPTRITNPSENGRFTKAVAHAVKSEALLYNASPLWNPSGDAAKWQAAAAAAKSAVDELTTGGVYALAQNYGEYFLNNSDINSDPKDKETIYERPGFRGGILSIINNIPSLPGGTNAGLCPSQELVDSYDMQATGEPPVLGYADADHLQPILNGSSGYDESNPYVGRDPRFYASVWFNGAQYDNIGGAIHTIETFVGGADQLIEGLNVKNTPTGYYLRKFINPKLQAGQGDGPGWKKYRLGKLYLNLAEAENEANGPTPIAYQAVNVIRRRVSMPDFPAGLTKEQFRERIRKERRVELAIEEDRFWDVRRWKILDQVDKLITGIRITKNTNNTFTHQRFLVLPRRNAWQDKYLIFPIPLGDASIVSDFQNPGW